MGPDPVLNPTAGKGGLSSSCCPVREGFRFFSSSEEETEAQSFSPSALVIQLRVVEAIFWPNSDLFLHTQASSHCPTSVCLLSAPLIHCQPSHHFLASHWGNNGHSDRLYFLRLRKSLQMVTAAMKLKAACSLEEKLLPT